jgi:hypothetical protein
MLRGALMAKVTTPTGSYASRKFVMAILCLLLVTGVSILSIWSARIPPILPAFVTGITGILVAYLGGNVARAHVQAKHDEEVKKVELKEEPKKEEKVLKSKTKTTKDNP